MLEGYGSPPLTIPSTSAWAASRTASTKAAAMLASRPTYASRCAWVLALSVGMRIVGSIPYFGT